MASARPLVATLVMVGIAWYLIPNQTPGLSSDARIDSKPPMKPR